VLQDHPSKRIGTRFTIANFQSRLSLVSPLIMFMRAVASFEDAFGSLKAFHELRASPF
jgi:hypothetical protein